MSGRENDRESRQTASEEADKPPVSTAVTPAEAVAPHPEHFSGETPGATAAVVTQRFSLSAGPLPHPEAFRSYDETLSGAADRILKMAEKQQSHRHAQERREMELKENDFEILTRGQWMGFVFGTLALIGAVLLVIVGRPVEGLTAMLLPVATIIGIFTMSKRVRRGTTQPEEASDNDSDPPLRLPNGP